MQTNTKIICSHCKHFYVTWENSKPNGCRAYGFKSKLICSLVVEQSSGISCNLFSQKNKIKKTNFKDDENYV